MSEQGLQGSENNNKQSRFLLFIPLLLLLGLCVLVLYLMVFRPMQTGEKYDPNYMPSALEHKSLPEFQLADLLDETITRSHKNITGKITLLNVWATWCISCKAEHPYLVELGNRGINIVGINYKDHQGKARQWLQKYGDPYAFSVQDSEGRLGIDLGVTGAPETYLVSAEGKVLLRHQGVMNEKVWQKKFLPLM